MFISSGEIDHGPAEDLQRYIENQDQKWLTITTPSWEYQPLSNSPYTSSGEQGDIFI